MTRVMRTVPLLGCLLVALTPSASAAQAVDTVVVGLPEAERMALENSPLLAPLHASVDLAEAQRSRAKHARFLPEFALRNVWGPIPKARGEFNEFGVLMSPDTSIGLGDLTYFTQVDVDLVQPLYTFGKIGSRIDAAGHQVDLKRADLEETRAEIRFQVRRLYWGAVLSEELLGVSRSVNERVEEAATRLQELYDEGSATQNDMFKFQIFEYEVGSRAREVETGRTKAMEALRAIIGLPRGTPVRVETRSLAALEFTLDELDGYVSVAMDNRPELAQLRAGIRARRALVAGAEADSWPSLFLAGQFRFNHAPDRFDPENPFLNDPTNFARAGLVFGVDWNLNLWRTNDDEQIERYELARLRAQAEPLRLKIEQEVREAYLDVVRARADVEAGREALQASENLLRAELQTFDIGLGDIETVIDAFESNVGMTVEQLDNIATLNTKLAELYRRVGLDLAGE